MAVMGTELHSALKLLKLVSELELVCVEHYKHSTVSGMFKSKDIFFLLHLLNDKTSTTFTSCNDIYFVSLLGY